MNIVMCTWLTCDVLCCILWCSRNMHVILDTCKCLHKYFSFLQTSLLSESFFSSMHARRGDPNKATIQLNGLHVCTIFGPIIIFQSNITYQHRGKNAVRREKKTAGAWVWSERLNRTFNVYVWCYIIFFLYSRSIHVMFYNLFYDVYIVYK
jgi:hypothetical protein